MPSTSPASRETIAASYQHVIAKTLPFVHSLDGEVTLIRPLPDLEPDQHRDALSLLVSQGVLTDYRYIDSQPQPAILAIRA